MAVIGPSALPGGMALLPLLEQAWRLIDCRRGIHRAPVIEAECLCQCRQHAAQLDRGCNAAAANRAVARSVRQWTAIDLHCQPAQFETTLNVAGKHVMIPRPQPAGGVKGWRDLLPD
jgi:hypothetical protein